jgi:putative intracellular protease/amidase
MTTPLRIAITIFPEAMALDWVGPLDILNTLSKEEGTKPKSIPSVKIVIVGDTLTPIKQSNGMMVTPEITYETARGQEWDAVLVPGGQGARPWYESNKACRDFLVEVVPKCRFVFTGMFPPSAASDHGCFAEQQYVLDRGSYPQQGF